MCVECLIGKQKKPILFKVTEPNWVYRAAEASLDMIKACKRDEEDERRTDKERKRTRDRQRGA